MSGVHTCDLMVRGINSGMPGHTTPSDMVPAPGSSGVVGPGVAGLLLSSYPGSPFLLDNWRQVENSVEQACS
jgi:hypothetical protein